tara:strand:+ start:4171 stop:5436 length:1266 start_codon:yes stop_codon:yes gene_type:complete
MSLQKETFKVRSTCRLCDGKKIKLILDMPSSQPVDNFRPVFSDHLNLESFEMNLFICNDCGHVQLLHIVNPDILYGNYIYESSSSPDLNKHFLKYADYLFDEGFLQEDSKILDIGSNDGLLLDFIKKRGAKTFGIDPAKSVSEIALNKGHIIFCDYLDKPLVKKIKISVGSSFNVITANNVFSHSDDLQSALECITNLLAEDGIYVFEVSYLLDTLRNRVIDYIYHEHLSYHSVKSLIPFLKKKDLYIYDIIKIPTKGGSIRVICGRDSKKENISLLSSMVSAEELEGIFSQETYTLIKNEILNSKNIIYDWIKKKKETTENIKFFGYGASATGTVLSNILSLDKFFSGIIDDNALRQNLLSPNSFLPIVSLESLIEEKNLVILILAWRFEKQIKKKIRKKLGEKPTIICVKPKIDKIIEI